MADQRVTMDQVVQGLQHLNAMTEAIGRDLLSIRQRIGVMEAKDKLRDAGRSMRLEPKFRSQYGEDILIWDVLAGQTEGFYIEVGAYDGKHFSVSWILDAIGWDGLLVEPLPTRFEECKRNRPAAHCVQAALSRRGSVGNATFTEAVGEGIAGMFSYLTTSQQHQQLLQREKVGTKTYQVPLSWMDKELERHPRSPKQVDVAVIDVEGGEVDVLEGFDLERWKPRMVMLEDNDRGANKKLEEWMKVNAPGYLFLTWLEVNRVYVRADDERIQRALTS